MVRLRKTQINWVDGKNQQTNTWGRWYGWECSMSDIFQFTGCTRPYHLPNINQNITIRFSWKTSWKKDVMRKHMKTFHSAVGRVPLTCDGLDVVLSQFELPGLICRNQPGLICRNQPEIICRNQPGIICRNHPGLICRNPTQLRATVFCDLKSVWISVWNKFHYNSGMSRQNILTRFHH